MSQDTVLNSNLRELHENDNPPPVWSEQAGSVKASISVGSAVPRLSKVNGNPNRSYYLDRITV